MKKAFWRNKLHLMTGALLLVTLVFTGGHDSAVASPNGGPISEPERQIDLDASPTNQIIIKYRANTGTPRFDATKMTALSTAADETLTYKRAMSGNAHVLSLPARISPAAVEAIARKLAALPDVEYAEPDYMMRPTLVPNDPSYPAQWHYYEAVGGINALAAWDITTGTASIAVAVIDTGISTSTRPLPH